MADTKYQPVPHKHADFLAAARQRPGFDAAYDSLALEYTVASQMRKARAKAGLTQDAVAERIYPSHLKTPAWERAAGRPAALQSLAGEQPRLRFAPGRPSRQTRPQTRYLQVGGVCAQ